MSAPGKRSKKLNSRVSMLPTESMRLVPPLMLAGPDGGVAEHRHPEQVEGGGHEQDAEDEFAQGASAGDAGDEETDEGDQEIHQAQ